MISIGLLWFDDDTRRPTTRKIADALERYRDRVGVEPTICLVNAAQLEALQTPTAIARPRARRAATATVAPITLPKTLTLAPSAAMSPNYFMVGVGAGETPRPVRGRVTAEEEYEGRGGRSSPSRAPRARSAPATPPPPAAAATPAASPQRQKRQAPAAAPEAPPKQRQKRQTPAAPVAPATVKTRQKRQTEPPPRVGEGAGGEVNPRQKRQRAVAPIAASASVEAAPATPAAPKQRQKRQTPPVTSPETRQKRQAHSPSPPQWGGGQGVGPSERQTPVPATPMPTLAHAAKPARRRQPATNDTASPITDTHRHTQKRKTA